MAANTNNNKIYDANIDEKAYGKSGALIRCTISPNKCVEHDYKDLIVASTLNALAVRSLNYSNSVHTSTPIQKSAAVTLVAKPSANEYSNGIEKAHPKQLVNYLLNFRGFNYWSKNQSSTEIQTDAVNITKIKLVNSQLNISIDKLHFLTSSSTVYTNLLPLLGLLSLVVVIIYEMVIVTVPYAKTESLIDISTLLQTKYNESIRWAQDQRLYAKLSPLLCGIAVAIFSFMLVYLDSEIPGVSPPSPFSPLKQTYRRERRSALHLGYIIALASGFVVTILMYCDFSSFEM